MNRPHEASTANMGWLVAAAMALACLRLGLFLHCLESFSSRDDAWMVAFASQLAAGGVVDHLAALVDWSIREFSGGTRVNVVLLGFVARWVDPTYGMVKFAGALVGGATFLAAAWALRGRVPRATFAWLWLLYLLPPIRALVVSAQFTGNHQELPVFLMLALGCALRLRDAPSAAAGRRWLRAWGFVTGIGIYYCQTYWLWAFAQGIVLLAEAILGRRSDRLGRSVLDFSVGLVPGALLCLLAYGSGHLSSILLPYEGSSDFAGDGLRFDWDRWVVAWRVAVGGQSPAGIVGLVGTSILWVPAALWVTRKDTTLLWGVSIPWTVFILGLVGLSAWTGSPIPRHLVPLVPGFLLFQALVLRHLGNRGGAMGKVTAVVLGTLVLWPRAADVSKLLPGSYSMGSAWSFPAEKLDELDVAGMPGTSTEALLPDLDALDEIPLSSAERRALLHGVGEVFWRRSGVDVEASLPFLFGAGPGSVKAFQLPSQVDGWFYTRRFAYLNQDPVVDELWSRESALESLYYAGVALGLAASADPAPTIAGCDPCAAGLAALASEVEDDAAVQFLEGRLCGGTPVY